MTDKPSPGDDFKRLLAEFEQATAGQPLEFPPQPASQPRKNGQLRLSVPPPPPPGRNGDAGKLTFGPPPPEPPVPTFEEHIRPYRESVEKARATYEKATAEVAATNALRRDIDAAAASIRGLSTGPIRKPELTPSQKFAMSEIEWQRYQESSWS